MFSLRNAILLTVLALALAVPGLAQGHQPTVTKAIVPIDTDTISNPCTGAPMHLIGDMKVTLIIFDEIAPNTYSGINHVVPNDVVATDLVTGQTYTVTGSTHISFIIPPSGVVSYTYTNNFNLVAPGQPTLGLHVTQHITWNANGVLTVSFYNEFVTCPGP